MNVGDHLDVEVEVRASFGAEGELTIEPPDIMTIVNGSASFTAGPLFVPERFIWRLRAANQGHGSIAIRAEAQMASFSVDIA